MLETHPPQAVPASAPTALISLSLPNSPPVIPDSQPPSLDALIPLYVSQGRTTSHRRG